MFSSSTWIDVPRKGLKIILLFVGPSPEDIDITHKPSPPILDYCKRQKLGGGKTKPHKEVGLHTLSQINNSAVFVA